MKKVSITSPEWETPIAVLAGDFIFLSGTTSKNPDGTYTSPGDIVGQTHVILARVEEALRAVGSSLENIVKITAYVHDIHQWKQFNQAYLEHFSSNRPARTTIQAGGFEEGACLELDVIAIRPD